MQISLIVLVLQHGRRAHTLYMSHDKQRENKLERQVRDKNDTNP